MSKSVQMIKLKCKEFGIFDNEIFVLLDELESKIELYENIEKCLYDSDLYLVYKHTDPTGKVYIGITQNHPQTRWNEGGGYEKQTKFYRAIQKYGWINFKHEIVAAGLTEESAKKLENQLILENKSYDEKYGYNTRFIKPTIEKTVDVYKEKVKKQVKKEKVIKNIPKKQISSIEISKKLIELYHIKFIDGIIYYIEDNKLVSDKQNNMIHRVLLRDYNIPLKQHSEIIKQVGFLSLTEKKSLTSDELRQIFVADDSVETWIRNESIQDNDIISLPTTQLYDLYLKWSLQNKIKTTKGKKQFFKYIEEKYQVEKRQKNDGKRYFVKQN